MQVEPSGLRAVVRRLQPPLPADPTRLQRLIDSTDREIDALVYDLYGLTPDEIAIVEKGEK